MVISLAPLLDTMAGTTPAAVAPQPHHHRAENPAGSGSVPFCRIHRRFGDRRRCV